MNNNDILKTISLSEIYAKEKERYIKMCEMLYPIREILFNSGFLIIDMTFMESSKYDIALIIRFSIIEGENFLMIHKNLGDNHFGITSDKVNNIHQVFKSYELDRVAKIMDDAIELGYGIEDKCYNIGNKYLVNVNNNFLAIHDINNDKDNDENHLSLKLYYDDFKNKKKAYCVDTDDKKMDKFLRKEKGLRFFLDNIIVDEKNLVKKYRK